MNPEGFVKVNLMQILHLCPLRFSCGELQRLHTNALLLQKYVVFCTKEKTTNHF